MTTEPSEAGGEFDAYHQLLGISKRDRPPSDYRLLGLDPLESDRGVIDTAANKQMAYLHGCVNGPHAASAQQLLNEVAAARLRLLNPTAKAAYDEQLRAAMDGPFPVQTSVVTDEQTFVPVEPSLEPTTAAPQVLDPAQIHIQARRRQRRSRSQAWLLPALIAGVTLAIVLWKLGLFDVVRE